MPNMPKTPDNTENDGYEAVSLISEDGKEEVFLHILTFPYEGEKYAALAPQALYNEDAAELVFMRIESRASGDTYVPVVNEVLLEELFAEFTSLFDEMDETLGTDAPVED